MVTSLISLEKRCVLCGPYRLAACHMNDRQTQVQQASMSTLNLYTISRAEFS